jgi:hypothetical protein
VQSFNDVKDVSRTSDAISHWDAFPILSADPQISPETLYYRAFVARDQLTDLGRIQSTFTALAEFISYAVRLYYVFGTMRRRRTQLRNRIAGMLHHFQSPYTTERWRSASPGSIGP